MAQITSAANRLMDGFEYEGYYQHRRARLVPEPALAQLALCFASGGLPLHAAICVEAAHRVQL